MSALRSALDEIASVDDRDLSVGELDSDIQELLDAQARIEVGLAEKTRELVRRNGHQTLEYPSPTAYLMHRGNLSAGRARRIVADAHATDKASGTHRAWADGRLSTDQARRIFAMTEAVPDEFSEAEEALVEIVEGLSVSDTYRAVEYWRQSVEGADDMSAETQSLRRGLSLSKSWDGMRRVDGWLIDTAGEALETALDALMPPPSEDDLRTPRQRRHDALEDLARDYLDHGDTPQVGGEKPHVMVLTDLDALNGVAGGTHETLNGGDILDVATVRMLACDSSVSRIVVGPDSEILDIGRKTRVWTTAQRRAIIARDRHCQADGCDRKPRWCDIHHEDHWADGGPTDVDKGKLFCRFHHVLEHIKEAKRRRHKT
jgi:hypothetical protein